MRSRTFLAIINIHFRRGLQRRRSKEKALELLCHVCDIDWMRALSLRLVLHRKLYEAALVAPARNMLGQ